MDSPIAPQHRTRHAAGTLGAAPNHPTPARWSRRWLLRRLCAAALAPAIAGACTRRDRDEDPSKASQTALWRSGIVPGGAAAISLGRRYHEQQPTRRSIGDLCHELGGDPLPTTPDQWRQAVAQKLRGDLESGRTIELDGWIVTLTEARLLALAGWSGFQRLGRAAHQG